MELFSPERRAKRVKFYRHKMWRKIRANQLRKCGFCEDCFGKSRKLIVASVCDHINPDWSDWSSFIKGPFRSLCHSCHNLRTFNEDIPALIREERKKIKEMDV